MRSLKDQIFLLVIGSVVCLMVSLMLVFYFYVKSVELKAVENKAKGDLATAEAIIDLKYPGPWQIRGNELYKGDICINNNYVIVDYIEELTGDVCSIYMNNICVTTTVREEGCNRAVGSYAPQEMRSIYLEGYYTGQTEIAGITYHTAFKAITDIYGQLIGVLYVGVPSTYYHDTLYGSIKVMGLAGLVLTLLIGLITRLLVARTIVKPLRKVIEGVERRAMNRTGQPLKIQSCNEIGELFQAFNQILVSMQKNSNGLHRAGEASRRTDGEYESPSKQGQASDSCNKDDEWFDALFDPQLELPKGLNRSTLKQIVLFLKKEEGNDVTIRDVSRAMCLSKVTVGRYFDYLEENGLVDVEQKYGSVGRPLRIFKLKA